MKLAGKKGDRLTDKPFNAVKKNGIPGQTAEDFSSILFSQFSNSSSPFFLQPSLSLSADIGENHKIRISSYSALNIPKKQQEIRISRPLNIASICLGSMGGSALVAKVVAEGLAIAGHKVSLLTSQNSFFSRNLEKIPTINVRSPLFPIKPEDDWVEPLKTDIVEYLRLHKTDVVHVHYIAGLLEAAISARDVLRSEGQKVSVIGTMHGTDVSLWGQNNQTFKRIKDSLLKSDGVSAVSHVLANHAHKIFDLSHPPKVISNAIESTTWNPLSSSNLRENLGLNGEILIAHSSNLREVKRPLDLILTFFKIRQQGFDAKLMIIGTGPMLGEMKQKASELHLVDQILFLGAISHDKLPELISIADLYLITSKSEGFCLGALEAMACGVPVVGTRCGGLEEILADVDRNSKGQSNLLSEVGDTLGLAQTSVSLLKDPQRYRRVQQECLKIAHCSFSRQTQIQEYINLIEGVCIGGD
jgi:N-acetyl-alpha-D-glucosaminyl L-malate synthase BshA